METETLNYVLALGTLGMQLASVALVAMYLLRTRSAFCRDFLNILSTWALWKGFGLTLLATAFTLYYSDVLGFIPCGLCWFERIFLYPQVVLFGIALWKRDFSVATYSIALSMCGAVIALYHHFIQMGGSELLPCPASGAGDCAQRIVFEFGYITFPLMACSLFVFLVVSMWITTRVRGDSF